VGTQKKADVVKIFDAAKNGKLASQGEQVHQHMGVMSL
jgi:hypothetical protein